MGMPDTWWSFDVSGLLTAYIKKPLAKDPLWTLPLSRPPRAGWAWRRLVILAIPLLWATLLRVAPQQGHHAQTQGVLAVRLQSNLWRRDTAGAAGTQCGDAGALPLPPWRENALRTHEGRVSTIQDPNIGEVGADCPQWQVGRKARNCWMHSLHGNGRQLGRGLTFSRKTLAAVLSSRTSD